MRSSTDEEGTLPPTYGIELHLDYVREEAARLTKPDEDFMPHVVVITPWEVKILPNIWQTDEAKWHFFDRTLPDFILRTKARSVIHASVAYMAQVTREEVTINEDGRMFGPSVSQRPGRSEVVIVTEASADSLDGFVAPLVRSTNAPPLLGDFERLPDERDAVHGLLRGPIRALRRVRSG